MFPFKLSFVTDADEAADAATTNSLTNEASGSINIAQQVGSFGFAGFSLAFEQVPCA